MATKNLFVDSTFTEAVSGQTSKYTGETLVWGENAFASMDSVVWGESGTLYAANLTLEELDLAEKTYDLVLDATKVATLKGGNNNVEVLTDTEKRSVFEATSITGVNQFKISNAATVRANEISVAKFAVSCDMLGNSLLVESANADIAEFSFDSKNFSENTSFSGKIFGIDSAASVFVILDDVQDGSYSEKYGTYLFTTGPSRNVYYSLNEAATAVTGFGREIVLDGSYESINDFAAGQKVVVRGADIVDLYGDSIKQAAGDLNVSIEVYGQDSKITNINLYKKQVPTSATVLLDDTSVEKILAPEAVANSKLILAKGAYLGGTSVVSDVFVNGDASVGAVINVTNTTIDANAKLSVADYASKNIFVDVSNYSGGLKLVLDSSVSLTYTSASVIGDTEKRYGIMETKSSIIVYDTQQVTDTFFCSTWTEGNLPADYNGTPLVWNYNAFSDFSKMMEAKPSQSITILSDMAAPELGALNLTVDNAKITGDLTGTGALVFRQNASVTGNVSGFSSITVDASSFDITDSMVKIAPVGNWDKTKVTVTGLKSGYSYGVTDDGVYISNGLLDRTYQNSNWNESITGTTFAETGEVLVWGVNAFSSKGNAMSRTKTGGTIYMDGNNGTTSFNSDRFLNAVLKNTTFTDLYLGPKDARNVTIGDVNVRLENVNINGHSNTLLGFGADNSFVNINGDVNVVFNGGTVGTTQSADRFYVATRANIYGDYTVTYNNTVLGYDFMLAYNLNMMGATAEEHHAITWNLINCTMPNAKWIAMSTHNANRPNVDYVLNISGSTFNQGDTRIALFSDNNDFQTGDVKVILDATYMAGHIVPHRETLEPNHWPTGYFTTYVNANYGERTFVDALRGLNEMVITAKAYYEGRSLVFQPTSDTKKSGIITVSVDGYTGGAKRVVSVREGLINFTESRLLDDADKRYYLANETNAVYLLDTKGGIYVNNEYDGSVTGTQVNGESLLYNVNALNDFGTAQGKYAEKLAGFIQITGGTYESIDLNDTITVISGGRVESLKNSGEKKDTNLTVKGGLINEISFSDAKSVALDIYGGTFAGKISASGDGEINMNVHGNMVAESGVDFKSITLSDVANTTLNSYGDIKAKTITIDATGYTGVSKILVSSTAGNQISADTINLIQDGESYKYKLSNDKSKLFILSDKAEDVYVFTNPDSVEIYRNVMVQPGIDAFAIDKFELASAAVKEGKTIYVAGEVAAGDLNVSTSVAATLHVDGSTNAFGKVTAGSLTGVKGQTLVIDEDVVFSEGADISGFGTVRFVPKAGKTYSVNSFTSADESAVNININVNSIADFEGQTYKLIQTAAKSNITLSQVGNKYGLYYDGEWIYAVKRDNIYLNASYDESISGTTHAVTGEVLYFGANAFNSNTAARDAMGNEGDTFYIDGGSFGGSLYGSPNYDVVVTNVTATTVYAYSGNNVIIETEKDQNLIINGSTLNSFRGFDQGKIDYPSFVKGDLDVKINDSNITQYVFVTWGDGTDSRVHNTMYGDINVELNNVTAGWDWNGGMGNMGTEDDGIKYTFVAKDSSFLPTGDGGNFYGLRLNRNDVTKVYIDEYNMTFINSQIGASDHDHNFYFIYSDDVYPEEVPNETVVKGNFTVTFDGSTVWGSSYINTGDIRDVEGTTMSVVVANKEGSSPVSYFKYSLKGFDHLIVESGAEAISGSSIHANRNVGIAPTIDMAFDSKIVAANGIIGDQGLTVTVDMKGYTNGLYMFMQGDGSTSIAADEIQLKNTDGIQTNFLKQSFNVENARRYFIIGTTDKTMYFNKTLTSEMNGSADAFSGGYQFLRETLNNGFWNAENDEYYFIGRDGENTFYENAKKIGATTVVITGGTYGKSEEGEINPVTYEITKQFDTIAVMNNTEIYGTVSSTNDANITIGNNAKIFGEVSGMDVVLQNNAFVETVVAKDEAILGQNASAGTITAGSIDFKAFKSEAGYRDLNATNITIDGTGTFNFDNFKATNLTIDLTGYTGSSRTIMTVVDGGTLDVKNPISVIGTEDYSAALSHGKINIFSSKVTDTYYNASWTAATCPEEINGNLLTFGFNAFGGEDIQKAIEKAADDAKVYCYGTPNGTITDTLGKTIVIDGTQTAVTLGDLAGKGGELVLIGDVAIGAITGFDKVTYKAMGGFKLTGIGEAGGSIAPAEEGKFVIDTSLVKYEECKTNFYKFLSNVTYAAAELSDSNAFRLMDGKRIGDESNNMYLLDVRRTYHDQTYPKQEFTMQDPINGDWLFYQINAWPGLTDAQNNIKVVGKDGSLIIRNRNADNIRVTKDQGYVEITGDSTNLNELVLSPNDYRSDQQGTIHGLTAVVDINTVNDNGSNNHLLGNGHGWTNDTKNWDGDIDVTIKNTTIANSGNIRIGHWNRFASGTTMTFTFQHCRIAGDFRTFLWDNEINADVVTLNFIDCDKNDGSRKWADLYNATWAFNSDVVFNFDNAQLGGLCYAIQTETGNYCNSGTVDFNFINGSVLGSLSFGATMNGNTDRTSTNYTQQAKTINVISGDNRLTDNGMTNVRYLDYININANATFSVENSISFVGANGDEKHFEITIDATDYKGGSKILIKAGPNGYLEGTGFAAYTPKATLIGDTTKYQAFTNQKMSAIVSLETDVFVNSDYTLTMEGVDNISGTKLGDELLFLNVNAFSFDSMDYAYDTAAARRTNLIVTGGNLEGTLSFNHEDMTLNVMYGDLVTTEGVEIGYDISVSNGADIVSGGNFSVGGDLTIAAGSSITSDGTISAGNIIVDVTGYEGGSMILMKSEYIRIGEEGKITLQGTGKENYELKQSDGNLILTYKFADNVFYNSSWDNEASFSAQYDETKFVTYKVNAFNDYATALSNLKEGYTFFFLGGKHDDIDMENKNVTIDGREIDGIPQTGAASAKNITTTGVLSIVGDVDIAEGSKITGVSALNYEARNGYVLTLDSIAMTEGSVVTISGDFDMDDKMMVKIIDTTVVESEDGVKTGGITGATTFVSSVAGAGVYCDGEDVYLVNTRYVYLNPDYTAEITGSTNEYTGEVMYYGINAFSTANGAHSAMTSVDGGTLFVTGGTKGLGTSIYGAPAYDVYAVGITASTIYAGSDNTSGQTYTGDGKTVYINGASISSVRVFDEGVNPRRSDAGTPDNPYKINLVIENSTVSGQYAATWAEGNGGRDAIWAVDGQIYGDIYMTVKNSTVGAGFLVYGAVGDETHYYNAYVTFDNVTATDAFYGVRMNSFVNAKPEQARNDKYFKTLTFNVTGYTSSSGFTPICTWQADQGVLEGDFVYSISGFSATELRTGNGLVDKRTTSEVFFKNIDGYNPTITTSGTIDGIGHLFIEKGITVTAGSVLINSVAKEGGVAKGGQFDGIEYKSGAIDMDVESELIGGSTVEASIIRVDVKGYKGKNRVVASATTLSVDVELRNNGGDKYAIKNDNNKVIVYDQTKVDNVYYSQVETEVVSGLVSKYDNEVFINGFNAFSYASDAISQLGKLGSEKSEFVIVGGTYGYIPEPEAENVPPILLYKDVTGDDKVSYTITISDGLYCNDVYLIGKETNLDGKDANLVVSGGTFMTKSVNLSEVREEGYSAVENGSISVSGSFSGVNFSGANVKNAVVNVIADSVVGSLKDFKSVNYDSNFGTLTVETDLAAGMEINVDVTGYTLGGMHLILVQGTEFTGKVNFIGDTEKNYISLSQKNEQTGKYELYAYDAGVITNTYVSADWTKGTVPQYYDGQIMAWGINAFSTIGEAEAALEHPEVYSVKIVSGTFNEALTGIAGGRTFTIDNAAAVSSIDTTNGAVKVVINTANFGDIAAGTAKVALTVDAELPAEGLTVSASGDGFAAYAFNGDVYLTRLSGNAYYDATYTADITGTTDSHSGEILVYGVNAFSTLNDAIAKTATEKNLYVYNYSGRFERNNTDHVSVYFYNDGGSLDPVRTSYAGRIDDRPVANSDITIGVYGAARFSDDGDFALLGKSSYVSGDASSNVRFNGKVNVEVIGTEDRYTDIGRLVLGDHLRLEQGYNVSLKYCNVVGDLNAISGDSQIIGGTVNISLDHVNMNGTYLTAYYPSWTFNANVVYTITDVVGNANARIAVNSQDSNNPNTGTTDFYVANTTIGSIRAGRNNNDPPESTVFSPKRKTLHFTGGTNNVLTDVRRFNEMEITGTDTIVNAASIILRDDTDVNSRVIVNVKGYEVAQKEVFTSNGTGIEGTANTKYELVQDDGAGYALTTKKNDAGNVTSIIVYKADALKNVYVNSTYSQVIDGSYYEATGDVLVYGVNAFKSLVSVASKLTAETDIYITGGRVLWADNFLSNVTVDDGALLECSAFETITVDGTFTNNGVVTFNPDSFETKDFNVVLSAKGGIFGNGDYQATSDYAFVREKYNDVDSVIMVARKDTVYYSSDWADKKLGEKFSVGGLNLTFGVDAFANAENVKQTAKAGAKIIAYGTQQEMDIKAGISDATITGVSAIYAEGADVNFKNIDASSTTVFSGGKATKTAEDKTISYENASVKRIYAGALYDDVKQEGAGATITATVKDTEAKLAGIFGGGEVLKGSNTILANTSLTVEDITATILSGGNYIDKGISNDEIVETIVNGNIKTNLTDVNVANFFIGSDAINVYDVVKRTGDINLSVDGGSVTTLMGGCYLQSSATVDTSTTPPTIIRIGSESTGNINIEIGGDAIVSNLYGAGGCKVVSASKTIWDDERLAEDSGITHNGNVNITIDVSKGAKVTSTVAAGSFGWGVVDGNTTITVKGSGKSDSFGTSTSLLTGDSTMRGDGGTSDTFVSGTKTLNVSNFNGKINGFIGYFDTINIENSSVNFDWKNINPLTNVTTSDEVMNWKLSSATKEQAAFTCNADDWAVSFAGRNLEFNCADLAEADDEWTCFSSAFESIEDFADIGSGSLRVNGSAFNLGDYDEDEMSYTSSDGLYQVKLSSSEEDGDKIIVSKLA